MAAGIQPWVTLFHWDYPYALYCRGGWLNRESPEWFARYTEIVVKKLSDRVRHWMTLNEPQCFIGRGHLEGLHAPGDKLGIREVLLLGHHALMSHGRGAQVIREHAQTPPIIGWAPVGKVYYPATDTPADIMDNFEWEYGYSKRLGLIHVDYATGRRILKDSARWYAKVIETNGASIGIPYERVEQF